MNKYILFFLLVYSPLLVLALPTIDNVIVTNAICKHDGTLEVLVSNTSGAVSYQLIAPSTVTQPNQSSNLFTGLPAGSYTIAVYDETTGGNPVKTVRTITSSYPELVLNNVVSSTDFSNVCTDNGQLEISYSGGRAPYNIKIVNTVTSEQQTQQTSSIASFIFSGLKSGNYQVSVTDQCFETRSTPSTVSVISSGSPLSGVPFTSLALISNPMPQGNDGCSKITLYLECSKILINGSNTIPDQYSRAIRYRVRYPSGTGIYTDWGTCHKASLFYINNFDLSRLQYDLEVEHPCSKEVRTLQITIPDPVKTFSINYNGVMGYIGFCELPTKAAATVNYSIPGIPNYVCAEYPFTLEFIPLSGIGTETKTFVWSESYAYLAKNLDLSTTYKVKVTDRLGVVLSPENFTVTTRTPTKPQSLIAMVPSLNPNGYQYNCNFNSFLLTYSLPTPEWTPVDFPVFRGKVTFSIYSGPATRDPVTIDYDAGPPYPSFLWTDLPYGSYQIKITYEECGRYEINTINRTQPIKSFHQLTVTSQNSSICGKYDLTAKAEFLNMSDVPIPGDSYVLLYKLGDDYTENYVSRSATIAGSHSTVSFTGLDAGNYIVKVRPFGYHYTGVSHVDENCVFASSDIISLAAYQPPTVNVQLSGGITCEDQPTGVFTIMVEDLSGSRPPYAYRMKPLGTPDASYTAWQPEKIFNNVAPGKYTVQVQDFCNSITTQELTMYYGLDQFLYIIGEISQGVICAGKTAVLSLRSVGPVVSYKWYKDGKLISGANGPTYMIESASYADIGTYSVTINNGYCDLSSNVAIIDVSYTLEPPVITGICSVDGNNTTLTATDNGEAVSFTWYKNGIVISGMNGNTYVATTPGAYTVSAKASGGCISYESEKYYVSFGVMYWSRNSVDDVWDNPVNWEKADGAKLNTVPSVCSDVHIPGNAVIYPDLNTNTFAVCRNIYFHFGSEVAKLHYLVYEKAFVQYHFGHYEGVEYRTDGDVGFSATPMKRGQWYALAAPLKKIVAGDFSFGGKPDFWRHGFIRNTVGGDFAGEFEAPNNSYALELGPEQLYAISVWAAKVEPGSIGEDAQYQVNLNQLKGIVEVPYFENRAVSDLHRIHQYISGKSRFYYYYYKRADQLIAWDVYDDFVRGREAYRFIFDKELFTVNYDGAELPVFKITVPKGKEVMIGNPFISTLDFDQFYQMNKTKISPSYRLYVDHSWIDYTYLSGSGLLNKCIAPLQAFFIQTTGTSGDVDLLFSPDQMSVTQPMGKLRSAKVGKQYDNVMYAHVSNGKGDSWMTLAAGIGEGCENVRRLFNLDPTYTDVPQVYTSDGSLKNSVQYFSSGESHSIPIGIKSSLKGMYEIRFDNLENMYVDSLVLVDKELKIRHNLFQNKAYVFQHQSGTLENRFQLLVGKAASTNIDHVTKLDIGIYTVGKWLHVEANEDIESIRVVTSQGLKVFSETQYRQKTFIKETHLQPGVYIVSVQLTNGMRKVEKVVLH